MKSTSFLLASLLAATALAQPHRQHKARHQHKQRAIDVVWVTETELVTEVVGVTTTVWVSPGYVAPSEPTTTSELSTTAPAAQFFQGASASASSSPVNVVAAPVQSTSSSSSAYVAPVETPAVEATSSSPAVVAAPAVTSTTLVSVASTPVAATASSSSSSSGSSSSSSGPCSGASDACEGDITYYTAGLGACGTTNDGDSQSVVALPHELMGTQSNGNPYCGKTITVTLNGVSTTALVVDKCMGCSGYSIDLSVKAFSDLTPDYVTIGRTTASWYFND